MAEVGKKKKEGAPVARTLGRSGSSPVRMDHTELNINEAAIECRRTQILTEVSLALDFAGLGTSPADVTNDLYLISYSSVHKLKSIHIYSNCVALLL
jgi:hypothetical protein